MYILGLVYIPWLVLISVFILLTLYAYGVYKHGYFKRRGIPAPATDLYWGHFKLMTKEGVHVFDLECTQKYGPVWGLFLGNCPSLVVCDPEIIKEICITQFSKFYNRHECVEIPKIWKNSLNNARDSTWKYLRAVLQPTFSSSKLKTMRPVMKRCLDEFSSSLEKKLAQSDDHALDIFEQYKALTMDVVCSSAFGIEVNSQANADDPFVKHASKILELSASSSTVLLLNFLFPDLRKPLMFFAKDFNDADAMAFLTATVKQAMNERKNDPNQMNDLLKLMMDTQTDNSDNGVSTAKSFEEMKSSGMSDENIVINGIIFLAAGYDTTASLLTFTTYCLATNPECQERLIAEVDQVTEKGKKDISYELITKMDYLDMFVQETLRMHPPANRYNREAACDVTIKGLTIEKGMCVMFSPNTLHRNPIYWPEPHTFDPERFSPENREKIVPFSFLPFGIGPRNCVGMKLALAEAKMAIVKLLQGYRVGRSAKLQEPPQVLKTSGVILKPENGMWVKIVKR